MLRAELQALPLRLWFGQLSASCPGTHTLIYLAFRFTEFKSM